MTEESVEKTRKKVRRRVEDALRKLDLDRSSGREKLETVCRILGVKAEVRYWVDGRHYAEYLCGCRDYSTILTDGTIGWGGWREACSFEHAE